MTDCLVHMDELSKASDDKSVVVSKAHDDDKAS